MTTWLIKEGFLKKAAYLALIVWFSAATPVVVWAQEANSTDSGQAVDATGDPTGAPELTGTSEENTGASEDTGATGCTGAGCGQGAGQGTSQGEDQGTDQGGPSLEDLGATQDEESNWVLPEGVEDTRQGASNGSSQGTDNGITAENSNTGAGSENSNDVDSSDSIKTSINNQVTDRTSADATGDTGNNEQSKNTGSTGIKTGNAGIGVTQVKNDNTAVIGGSAGLTVEGYEGNKNGDLSLGFGSGTANLKQGEGVGSVKAVNKTTGSDSTNSNSIETDMEELNEVQNDGRIDNLLDLAAITGKNKANKNTGDGAISTGDADVAATLVNLLNTTVINGDIWLTIADIFGDLNGNINLPDLSELAKRIGGRSDLLVEAVNEETGEDSKNLIDVGVGDKEKTVVENDADINTEVNAKAITGENETVANTGGGQIQTGDASVSASNISIANTTVEGGNWGLVVVNALNKWLGFLVGDNGEVRELSQEETIRRIEAHNKETGQGSENEIDVEAENERETIVKNDAKINNQVNAEAVTGENEANKNTGQGRIETGNANVEATAVNIANTTVKDGSLFIAVVNIMGDWLGNLIYGGNALVAAGDGARGDSVEIDGVNKDTGANSENEIDVEVDREKETEIDNKASIDTVLNAEIDTGSNKANRNTTGADIITGNGWLASHSGVVANLTGVLIDPALGVKVSGLNDTTGFESTNRIRAKVNDERVVEVTNLANVSTLFWGLINTGENEASKNTVGGNIATGDAGADLAVNNLVNKVMLALAGAGGSVEASGNKAEVDADLINRITGAMSKNSNDVELVNDLLVKIQNDGAISNLIDLLLNTGRNVANENTEGGNISSGDVCPEGYVYNKINDVGLAGLGGASVDLGNEMEVVNDADVRAVSGQNKTNRNTDAGLPAADKEGVCVKLALAPEEPESMETPGEEEPEEEELEEEELEEEELEEEISGGVGGGEEEGEGEERGPRVAGIVSKGKEIGQEAAGSVLKRFPVAGEEGIAYWTVGSAEKDKWIIFAVLSALVLGWAWYSDKQALKEKKLLLVERLAVFLR